MVVHAFHHADGAEPHRLPDGEAGEHERERRADGVEEEGFGEGVVEGAEGVGHVDFVMVGVDVACVDVIRGGAGFGDCLACSRL